jgi:hypothetical protein
MIRFQRQAVLQERLAFSKATAAEALSFGWGQSVGNTTVPTLPSDAALLVPTFISVGNTYFNHPSQDGERGCWDPMQ